MCVCVHLCASIPLLCTRPHCWDQPVSLLLSTNTHNTHRFNTHIYYTPNIQVSPVHTSYNRDCFHSSFKLMIHLPFSIFISIFNFISSSPVGRATAHSHIGPGAPCVRIAITAWAGHRESRQLLFRFIQSDCLCFVNLGVGLGLEKVRGGNKLPYYPPLLLH